MIKKIASAETHHLRREVLGKNIKDYQFIYQGDDEVNTVHLGYFEGGDLVGILTVMKIAAHIYQFRGMAVAFNFQGKNMARQLLQEAETRLVPAGSKIWLNAREKVIPFYLKNGFLKEGEMFNIPPIGFHLKMSKLT